MINHNYKKYNRGSITLLFIWENIGLPGAISNILGGDDGLLKISKYKTINIQIDIIKWLYW